MIIIFNSLIKQNKDLKHAYPINTLMPNNLIPLMLNIQNKKIVIFGGGKVGERRAKLFSEYGEVVCISKNFNNGFNKLNIIKIKKEINKDNFKEFLNKAFIVIPATNDKQLNEEIASYCKQNGILLNQVNKVGDIVVPSIVKKGDILIGISSGSPSLTKYMRKKFEKEIGKEFSLMAKLQKEVKKRLKGKVKEQKIREIILKKIVKNQNLWELLKGDDYEKAIKSAKEMLK